MFSCCSAPKHTKLLTGVLCFVGALVCFFAVGPVYVSTLMTPVSQFADCIDCASTYATSVINEVNGTAIVDQIIHSHDQKQFHRGSKKPDICITEEDLEDLDLDSLDVKPMPRKCIDTCSPIAARIGLAVAWACATGFAAICLLLTSLAAFFSFCCCNPTEPPTYFMVDSGPSTSHGTPQPPTGTATRYADALKAPLMPEEQ